MKQRNVFSRTGLIFSSLLGLMVSASTARAFDAVPGEYLVKYKESSALAQVSVRSIAGVRLLSHNLVGHYLKVGVAQATEPQVLARLLRDPNVEYVVPNVRLHMLTVPVEADALKDQWALPKVHAQEAWARAGNKGSRNVVVAVIDTGADYNHESLKANMIPGYNFKDMNDDPMDKTAAGGNPGHGTHCSGIIGSTGLVDGGTSGISPEVSIMPLRFLDEKGQGDLDAGVKAIDYAISKHVQVISASWGASVDQATAQPLLDAVKRADDAGIIFVAAAANDGANNDNKEVYPANANGVNSITVAASDRNDGKPSWSNYGKRRVHLASPGDTIMSTLPGNKYGNLSGTSMATPLVAGMVALIKAQDPTLSGAQVRALLQLTGTKTSIETACNCRVDALASVDALLNKKMFVTPAAGTIEIGGTQQFSGTYGKPPYQFAVDNASVGTISDTGLFTAASLGTAHVTVRDAAGMTSTSLDINVVNKGNAQPAPSPGQPGNCPLGDQSLCDAICGIQPTLPFCKH